MEISKTRLAGANNSALTVLGTVKLPVIVHKNMDVFSTMRDREVNLVNNVKDIESVNHIQSKGVEGKGNKFLIEFTVVRDLAAECIIGTAVWPSLGIVINSKENYLEICQNRLSLTREETFPISEVTLEANSVCWIKCKTNSKKAINVEGGVISNYGLVIPGLVQPKDNGEFEVLVWNTNKENKIKILPEEVLIVTDLDFEEVPEDEHFSLKKVIIGSNDNKKVRLIKKLLLRNRDRFRERTGPGERYTGEEAEFLMKSNATPQVDKLYSRKPSDHEMVDMEINKLLERDLIEKNNGAWRANTLLVKKKDGSVRFTVDYRLSFPESVSVSQ
jgi:hypothetical protein